eukprot:1157726-Pelagomonas_calceolata.AAC.3
MADKELHHHATMLMLMRITATTGAMHEYEPPPAPQALFRMQILPAAHIHECQPQFKVWLVYVPGVKPVLELGGSGT